jgi:catechol 2,3-dioxygenase
MTQIKGHIAPTRRPGALGVHSLDHFAFSVPDLAVAADFYQAFGLEVRAVGNHLDLYTKGHPHRWVRLSEGPRKALGYVSLGVFEDDLERFKAHFAALGVVQTDAPAGVESNGIWVKDCNGVPIEIKVAEKSSPNAKSVFEMVSAPEGVPGAPIRGVSAPVMPRRLAHLLMYAPAVDNTIAFYGRTFGLRVSDRAGGGAFMHGIHGSDHHMIAFGPSAAPGMHHCSWDVGSVNDVGLGAMQMADKGFSAGWGLGRHVLGSNYFHYVRDPWGSYSEYSADIDYIPATVDWEDKEHAPENSFYLWGPLPPQDFGFNYEI